jgi:hypothetical protein
MTLLALFFAGALLLNAIPHLAAGTLGQGFPTPFAKPRGIGFSSPLVNFAWGTFNLVVGLVLLDSHPVPGVFSPEAAAMLAGFVLLGQHLARHFGKVRDGQL